MTRPRRPILAITCAALLLATVGQWVRSNIACDRFGRIVSVGNDGDGSVRTSVTIVTTRWGGLEITRRSGYGPPTPWTYMRGVYEYQGGVWADRIRENLPWPIAVGNAVFIPYWVVAPLPAFGLWWSWRGRKAGAGFPVEPMEGNGAAKQEVATVRS
jgi:hypothetical protein